jgi:hypothetical protein
MVRRALILGYGAVAYVAFLAVFSYTVGFVANSGVPKGIDDGSPSPVALAVLVDAGLLTLFALQRSIMARPWFKRWWTRFVPASIERSTFVLAASLVLAVQLWQWRPLPAEVWSVEGAWSRAALWGRVRVRMADGGRQYVPDRSLRPVRAATGGHAGTGSGPSSRSGSASPCCTGWCATRSWWDS